MKYEKPEVTTLDELSAMGWAIPKDDGYESSLQVVTSSKSTSAGCHCTNGQSKVSYSPKKLTRNVEHSIRP